MSESTTGNQIDPDGVDHPKHYNVDPSGIECIEIARHLNFNVGSAFKYVFRAGEKQLSFTEYNTAALHDIEKALWYISDEIKMQGNLLPIIPGSISKKLLTLVASREGLEASFLQEIFMAVNTSSRSVYLDYLREAVKVLKEYATNLRAMS